MLNLSLKVGNQKIFFAGKVQTLPVSQKMPVCLPTLTTDIFEKTTDNEETKKLLKQTNIFSFIDNESQYAKYFPSLSNKNQFSKETYFQASKEEKEFAKIIANKPIAYMEEVKSAEKYADAIKQNLDFKYGKNKYSVFGIGRSVSIITELLKLNGVKSESVPFTHGLVTRHPEYKNPDVLLQKMDWKKYFEQFGFDEKTLTDKNKTTIVTDFAFSGNTLSYFEKFMNHLYPNNNIKYINISDLTIDIPNEIRNENKISQKDTARFLFAIAECDYKQVFSTCPHLWEVENYANYKQVDYKYPLLTKIILLNYLDNKIENA